MAMELVALVDLVAGEPIGPVGEWRENSTSNPPLGIGQEMVHRVGKSTTANGCSGWRSTGLQVFPLVEILLFGGFRVCPKIIKLPFDLFAPLARRVPCQGGVFPRFWGGFSRFVAILIPFQFGAVGCSQPHPALGESQEILEKQAPER